MTGMGRPKQGNLGAFWLWLLGVFIIALIAIITNH